MKSVGIIANPASGKDIRRLVAFGAVVGNHEKVNVLKRMLMALDALEVKEVWFMPDAAGLGYRAADGLKVSLRVSLLDMEVESTAEDSLKAAALLAEKGVACLITLGGDGTNRVVAKACGETPLLPVSTGTNNVFPFQIEGTLAGLAAGLVARGDLTPEEVCRRAPRLEVWDQEGLRDIALVDVAVSRQEFVAARAVWDPESIRELFLARSEPGQIGLSAIGGHLRPLAHLSGQGLHLTLGPGGSKVLAPIAPGLVRTISVRRHRLMAAGEAVPITAAPATLALDGEREIVVRRKNDLSVRLSGQGPWVVDAATVLIEAGRRNLFVRNGRGRKK